MRSALAVLLLALPLLAQGDDEIPPGPLKELTEGLKRGDTEIRIDVRQSRLDSIEHSLQEDRAKGIADLREFLAELGPAAKAAEPEIGDATAYNDAITLARRHKVVDVKDAYVMSATPSQCGFLGFRLPMSGRWEYKDQKGAGGVIYQHDRKGRLVRTIEIRFFFKRFTYTQGAETFDGADVAMLAKAGMAAAVASLPKVTRRAGVYKKRLNDEIRVTSGFLVEGQAVDDGFVRYRSYYFNFKWDEEGSIKVGVRDLVDEPERDPEAAAVLATMEMKGKKK